MRKKRSAERKQTRQFFGVYHRQTEKYVGRLLDLSIKGMKVLAKKPIEAHTLYEFRIELPRPITGKNELTFDARCVWCAGSSENEGKYEAGFQIVKITFDQIEAIQYLLSDDLFSNPEMHPRFTLEEKPSKP